MPVSFLTSAQRESYGRYAAPLSPDELARFFHLSEDDQALILNRRGDHNRLGFALQLTTVRFLGTFLEDSIAVPSEVVQTLSRQLGISKSEAIGEYRQGRWRRQHATEIRTQFGYSDFSDPAAGFRLARWLCALCWTGTERPSVLFDRATAWLLTHKVLLPGVSVLERFIARLRGPHGKPGRATGAPGGFAYRTRRQARFGAGAGPRWCAPSSDCKTFVAWKSGCRRRYTG